jgi:hypothetical protein
LRPTPGGTLEIPGYTHHFLISGEWDLPLLKDLLQEIDTGDFEHYCDVIVSRWEQFTGKKAELINGNE